MTEQAGNLSHLAPFVLDSPQLKVSSQVHFSQSDAVIWQNILVSILLAAAKKWLHSSVGLSVIFHRHALKTISLRSIAGRERKKKWKYSINSLQKLAASFARTTGTCVHPDLPVHSRPTRVAAHVQLRQRHKENAPGSRAPFRQTR